MAGCVFQWPTTLASTWPSRSTSLMGRAESESVAEAVSAAVPSLFVAESTMASRFDLRLTRTPVQPCGRPEESAGPAAATSIRTMSRTSDSGLRPTTFRPWISAAYRPRYVAPVAVPVRRYSAAIRALPASSNLP